MTISRDESFLFINCDGCPDYIECDTEVFMEAMEDMKREGWLLRNRDGVWLHYCPDCQEKGKGK